MARYTISYEEMHNLMTPAQKAQETSIFALITNTTLRDSFRKYYELYYRECEIETGTPAGYLLDFNRCMISAAGYINNIFAQLDKDGYLTHKNESETKTGNATKTDTPGITTTTETDNIFSDTPQSTQRTLQKQRVNQARPEKIHITMNIRKPLHQRQMKERCTAY